VLSRQRLRLKTHIFGSPLSLFTTRVHDTRNALVSCVQNLMDSVMGTSSSDTSEQKHDPPDIFNPTPINSSSRPVTPEDGTDIDSKHDSDCSMDGSTSPPSEFPRASLYLNCHQQKVPHRRAPWYMNYGGTLVDETRNDYSGASGKPVEVELAHAQGPPPPPNFRVCTCTRPYQRSFSFPHPFFRTRLGNWAGWKLHQFPRHVLFAS
jgi:hypothetical protein